jgi:hypothetical protein
MMFLRRTRGDRIALVTLLVAGAAALSVRYADANTLPHPGDDVPSVSIGYSSLLDAACAMMLTRPLDSAFVAGVVAQVPTYQRAWAARAPELLRTARTIAGQPYRFNETTAALVTCGIPSMSFPLVLNARSFSKISGGSEADEVSMFVNTLFHELMHRYIGDQLRTLPSTTPLLAKYASEPVIVRNHLHLFALQELVYRQLKLDGELARAEALDRALRNGALFTRTREIVAAEGAAAFVAELRPAP